MKLQVLAPGMQDCEDPDLGTQVLGIRGHLDQGLGGRSHQQAVDFLGIGQGEGIENPRQGQDDVEIGHIEQVGRLSLQPARRRGALAFGAVAVATRVVADLLVPTLGTPQDVSAQGGRAAGGQIVQGAPLLGCEAPAVSLEERVVAAPDDRGEIQFGSGHG